MRRFINMAEWRSRWSGLETVEEAVKVVKDELDVIKRMFHALTGLAISLERLLNS